MSCDASCGEEKKECWVQDGVVAKQYLESYEQFQRQAKMWTGEVAESLMPVRISGTRSVVLTLHVSAESYASLALAYAEDEKVN